MKKDKPKDKKIEFEKVEQIIEAYEHHDGMLTNPNGSYTGRPENPNEKPEQDADDL